MGSLVWLFADYRNAVLKIQDLEREVLKQRVLIEMYERAPTTPPTSVDSLLKEFQDMILSEQPYPDGKIPEHAYLTPGE